MQYTIKAMSLGEILDQAIQLAKDNFKDLFIIVTILYGPILLVSQFMATVSVKDLRPVYHPAAFLVTMLGMIVALPLVKASAITYISNKYLGVPISAGAAMRRSFHFLIPMIFTYIMVYLCVAVGFVLLIIPGLFLLFRLILINEVIVIEDTGYSAAMSRSWRLMKGNVGTVFVLGFILGIIMIVAGSIAGLIPVHLIAVLVRVLIQIVTLILGAAAFVVFYFSVRCKNENFDLQVLASELQRSAATAGSMQ